VQIQAVNLHDPMECFPRLRRLYLVEALALNPTQQAFDSGMVFHVGGMVF
jgi:hypothetical protein